MIETAHEPTAILLVDDRRSNLVALETLLARPDYELVLAESGREALARVLRRDFAVILLDVAMPGMDGFEVASILKQRDRSKHIPIIFITASAFDMDHVFRGYTVGAVDYLRRPLDPHAVRSKVAVFVELYRQRKTIERQEVRLREAEQYLRERAEKALEETEALYQYTFEAAPIGIGDASPDGRWTRTNRRLGEILGIDHESLAGKPVEIVGAGQDAVAIARRLDSVRAGMAVSRGEHRLATARGTLRWAQLIISALRDPAGFVSHFIVIVEDITDRMRDELERARLVDELQRGIRARDDFLSVAAHELKTPLTPLRLRTDRLAELAKGSEPLSKEELIDRIAKIDDSTRRLEGLVDRLLNASNLSVGDLALQLDDIDLAEVVSDVVNRLQGHADRAGSSIFLDAERPVIGHWDRLRLDQAANDLIANAIKFGAGQPIEVTVKADDDHACLSVRDHGPGIPEEAQARLFERFERPAPLKHFGGFGLGLWLVRRIVEAQGGHVSVKSRPGDGAEFYVDLPRDAASKPTVVSRSALEVHA